MLKLIQLFKHIGIHGVVPASLLKLLFCCSENLNVFVLFRSIQLCPLGLLFKNGLLAYVLRRMQGHALKVVVLQNSE